MLSTSPSWEHVIWLSELSKLEQATCAVRIHIQHTHTHTYKQHGRTALYYAASLKYEDIVEHLLGANADPDLQDMVINLHEQLRIQFTSRSSSV